MFLDKSLFSTIIKHAPLVSIDLIIESEGQILLGRRLNRPAKDFWFVPGGRILKGESQVQAFARLTQAELGVELELKDAQLLGTYDHFYKDNVFGDDFSTHYVAIAYRIRVGREKLSNLPFGEQHNQYRWVNEKELLADESVHAHSKWYFEPPN